MTRRAAIPTAKPARTGTAARPNAASQTRVRARARSAALSRALPPVLDTARLVMAPATDGDVEAFVAFCATHRSRFIGGPSGREDAWRSVAMHVGHWHLRGFGLWWLTERETGRPAGRAGLWQPEGMAEPELNCVVYDGFEGRGLASEAARAARDWAYGTLGRSTLVSLIAAENVRAVRLAERLGARPDGTVDWPGGGPVMRWRHPGPQVTP